MSQTIIEVALDDILPSPTNPRKYFNQQALTELADSIKKTKGVIQAITVRMHPKLTKKYELVCHTHYSIYCFLSYPKVSRNAMPR